MTLNQGSSTGDIPGVVGRTLNQPLVVRHLLNNQSVSSIQETFLLTEVDFERLQSSHSRASAVAALLFSAVVGYSISLVPKLLPILQGGRSQVEANEWKTIIGCLVLSLLIFLVGLFLPNKKKQVIKKINKHFNETDNKYAVTRGEGNE